MMMHGPANVNRTRGTFSLEIPSTFSVSLLFRCIVITKTENTKHILWITCIKMGRGITSHLGLCITGVVSLESIVKQQVR
jgi:hypothetical protein